MKEHNLLVVVVSFELLILTSIWFQDLLKKATDAEALLAEANLKVSVILPHPPHSHSHSHPLSLLLLSSKQLSRSWRLEQRL